MLRKVTLSLLMLVSVVVMLPFDGSTAHGLRQSSASQQHRRYRRHSRAWWRRYRARLRFRRAAAAAALAKRNAARQVAAQKSAAHTNLPLGPVFESATKVNASTRLVPKVPAGWSAMGSLNGEVRFRTEATTSVPSQATLSVVARSRPEPAYLTYREQSRMLSGVAFSDLRRIVIDKMINAGGWVINDYERKVNGARVFVVIAQTPSDGRSPEKAWNFYFAEVDGKIYSLTLNTPLQFSDRLAGEGERFLGSIGATAKPSAQPATP
jgi:hypothetical protein